MKAEGEDSGRRRIFFAGGKKSLRTQKTGMPYIAGSGKKMLGKRTNRKA